MVMFALSLSEDRASKQERREEIMEGLGDLTKALHDLLTSLLLGGTILTQRQSEHDHSHKPKQERREEIMEGLGQISEQFKQILKLNDPIKDL
jgi:molecular chaperone GrpE (heat shock protein)